MINPPNEVAVKSLMSEISSHSGHGPGEKCDVCLFFDALDANPEEPIDRLLAGMFISTGIPAVVMLGLGPEGMSRLISNCRFILYCGIKIGRNQQLEEMMEKPQA